MTHKEFLEAYRERKVSIKINKSEALRLVQTKLFDKSTATAFLILTWISVLLFPTAIAIFIWLNKLISLLVLLLALMLPSTIRTSAAQSVRDLILKDEEKFDFLININVVTIERVNSDSV